MTSSNFASFAPYAPPPDDPSYTVGQSSSSKPSAKPWFPVSASSQNGIESSYQSGGIPTFGASETGGIGAADGPEGQQNQWETRYGWRVDVLAAVSYLFGPISALVVLIIETQNDYVRFHAYQSALLTSPFVIFRIFASLVGFTPWLRTFLSILIILLDVFMAYRAYFDASQRGLVRFQLPYIGPIADQWVSEE